MGSIQTEGARRMSFAEQHFQNFTFTSPSDGLNFLSLNQSDNFGFEVKKQLMRMRTFFPNILPIRSVEI